MTQPAEPTKNEQARLERLRKLMILDSSTEPLFNQITQCASEICGTPIALISLVDETRQWFKANEGLDGVAETPRDIAFCSHTILDNELMEVEDARADSRFKNNPLVTSDPSIRFYAGMPLTLPDGFNVGTLCVIDNEPKKLTEYQKETLGKLATITCQALLLREHGVHEAKKSASLLAGIVESSEDAIVSKSLDGKITSWNTAAENMFGHSAAEMIGNNINTIIPLDKQQEEAALIKQVKSNQNVQHYETERITKDHQRIQISISLSPIKDAHGKIIGISKIARDVTEFKKLERTLAEEHEQLRVTMDSIGDAVISTDKRGLVTYLNPVAEALTGWSNHKAAGLPLAKVFNIINEITRKPCPNPVQKCLKEDRIIGLESNTALISLDGNEYGIEDSAAPIRDSNGNTIGVVLVFHDVTKERVMSNEISYRAKHDRLTGIINRSEFEVLLEQYVNDYKEPDTLNSLMFIDLDQFKIINDTGGHAAGDKLLIEITKAIQSCIRTSDVFARIGGDEFAIILKKTNTEKALAIANKICKTVDHFRFIHNNQKFHIGASIGLVMIDNHWANMSDLLQAADHACYEAKHAGRNQVKLHHVDDAAFEIKKNEAQCASRIETALEENQFRLFCQRIVPLNDSGLEHIEVLLRLKDETEGYVSPGLFLPAAERFHMMSRIDRWVVANTFAWIESNIEQLAHIDLISINLSGQSLNNKTFHRVIKGLLDSADFDISKICFEITETVAITNIADTIHFLNLLKASGVQFSLDDFGSGVSSFGYIKNLPVDYLKIDGQFIKDITDNEISQATVRCIAEIAKITGKKTIAEWVENAAVENMLKDMGVDYVQGYFRHKPAPIDAVLLDVGTDARSQSNTA